MGDNVPPFEVNSLLLIIALRIFVTESPDYGVQKESKQ